MNAILTRAPTKRTTPTRAIAENCKSCVYDPANAGTWRQQVELCSVTSCPLWTHRPLSAGPITDALIAEYGLDAAAVARIYAHRESRGRRKPSRTGPTFARPRMAEIEGTARASS